MTQRDYVQFKRNRERPGWQEFLLALAVTAPVMAGLMACYFVGQNLP